MSSSAILFYFDSKIRRWTYSTTICDRLSVGYGQSVLLCTTLLPVRGRLQCDSKIGSNGHNVRTDNKPWTVAKFHRTISARSEYVQLFNVFYDDNNIWLQFRCCDGGGGGSTKKAGNVNNSRNHMFSVSRGKCCHRSRGWRLTRRISRDSPWAVTAGENAQTKRTNRLPRVRAATVTPPARFWTAGPFVFRPPSASCSVNVGQPGPLLSRLRDIDNRIVIYDE